jgi:transcriptional regulator with XRE-family HTH domain
MEELMAKNIGRAKLVKKERLERAWSQTQLATVAGVNLRTVQRLEKDGSAALDTLMGVAQAFGIDVKELNPTTGKAISKESLQAIKKVHFLSRLVTGKNLSDVILGADQFQVEHDEAQDPRAVAAMKDILKLLKLDIVRIHEADPVARLQIEIEMTQEIQGLEKYGFYLFGMKRVIPRIVENKESLITMCTLFMSHAHSPKIIQDKKFNMMMPALLSEIVR